jgi:hypothetical protein
MKRVRYIVGASLLFTGIAAAQPAPDPASPDAPPLDGTAPAVVPAGAAMGTEMISQPMTLAASKMSVYGHLDLVHFSSPAVGMVPSSSVTSEGVDVGFGYGVSDKLTVGATYAFALHDFEIKGPLTLYGTYSLYNKDKLTVAASANLTFDFDSTDAMGNTSVDTTLNAGLGVRYLVAPKIAVYTGGTPTAGSGPSVAGAVPAFTPTQGGILGQHLTIGLYSDAPITLDLPIGAAFQATPQIFLWVNSSIGHIKISNSANAFLFADFIPINVGANYMASKNLEVEAYLSLPDVENSQFDLLFFGIGARYYN